MAKEKTKIKNIPPNLYTNTVLQLLNCFVFCTEIYIPILEIQYSRIEQIIIFWTMRVSFSLSEKEIMVI